MRELSAAGCILIVGFVGIIAASFFSLAMLGFFGPLFKDVNREIIQHSQQYVESKTQLLLGIMSDHEDPLATVGQKKAMVNEFCYQVTLLLPEERPTVIARFEAEHC